MSQINQDIFKRYSTRTKKNIVSKLSINDLLSVSEDTLVRIVKEVGRGSGNKLRNHNKELRIRCSAGWNFQFEEVYYTNKKLCFAGCVFYENTDSGHISLSYRELVSRGTTCKAWSYEDRYDNPQTVYCNVGESDKANVIQAILNTYIDIKEQRKHAE